MLKSHILNIRNWVQTQRVFLRQSLKCCAFLTLPQASGADCQMEGGQFNNLLSICQIIKPDILQFVKGQKLELFRGKVKKNIKLQT